MAAADQPSGSPNSLDVMNDPAFDNHGMGGRKKSVDEPDTCRICRAEASNEEPLFYPCKCSGSIKFVHQSCLMEWLSHSQKKHCELCKTPFRFTKLYSPHMPAAVPTFIFVRQAMIHTWKSLIAWSRMHLVVIVWLGWLPWSMRTVWRGLFWIGDGGWFSWHQMEEEALKAAKERLNKLAAEGMSPVPRSFFFSSRDAASIMISRLAEAIPQMVSRTLNLTLSEPITFRLARGLLRKLTSQARANDTVSLPHIPTVNASNVPDIPYRFSWLSEVGFLKTLTRYPVLNNIFIDVLEGQLITLFIVVAFILVFLIREWVVQQRPVLNLPAIAQVQEALPAIEEGNGEPEQLPEVVEIAPQDSDETLHDLQAANADALPESAIQQSLLETDDPETHGDSIESKVAWEDREDLQQILNSEETNANKEYLENSHQRPGMPDRGTLARAAEIRRTIEEQSRATGQDWSGLKIFMDLWTRADNTPKEVLRIIEEEGRCEELSWVVEAMGRLENISVSAIDRTLSANILAEEDITSNAGVTGNETARSVLARRTYESGYDLSKGLGVSDSLDGLSSAAERGSSAPTDRVHENNAVNPDVLPLNVAEDSGAIEARDPDGLQSVAQLSNPAPTSGQPSHELSTNTIDNPFHPDYTGQLPPHPQENLSAEDHVPVLPPEDATAESAERLHPPQASSSQANTTRVEPTQTLIERTMTWLWGEARPGTEDVNEQAAADDEHVVQDLANEAPFVPMEGGQPLLDEHELAVEMPGGQEPVQELQMDAQAIQVGFEPNDAEIAEEVEDLEGVMELVGMQGPIAGLIQNGMFCAVLVSLTIFLALWIPYIMGKFCFIILANPVSFLLKAPLRWASASADVLSDTFIFGITWSYYWVAKTVTFLCSPMKKFSFIAHLLYGEDILADFAKDYADRSLRRLSETLLVTASSLSESDIPTFSIVAHESLRMLQQRLSDKIDFFIHFAVAMCTLEFEPHVGIAQIYQHFNNWQAFRGLITRVPVESKFVYDITIDWLRDMSLRLSSLRHVNLLRLNVAIPQRTHPLDYSLAYWDSKDRALAIVFGYLFFGVLGSLYLRLNRIIQGKKEAGKAEGVLADVLYQAGGVLKVILIISIEMIVFPLYCGLLLDVGLLPLFRNVTLLSRLEFMVDSPYTSLFIHWFVGTCYMFHFALFVSMCRKIMRSGVLYFIRDPDDPTFHPVRDVLERSVFTQLYKIAFSALVYGGLVIVCLGGVVWGISSAFNGVFPIHWSSNEPVLEFPVDLLFYNFLMPLAVKYLRPSDALSKMYAWWFRKCARALRLSHFLFGDRKDDEEGYLPRRTWRAVFAGKQGDAKSLVKGDDRQGLTEDGEVDASFLRDGRFVRTPASDQVRIPKGSHTFVEVDEAGNRVDGQPDNDQGLHGRNNEQFSTIYIPPHFRLRIGAFIFLLWLFAAATGVCITVIPLLFGRYTFSHVFPSHPRMNDVYAFSIGINLLGGALFLAANVRPTLGQLRQSTIAYHGATILGILRRVLDFAGRLLRVLYIYTAFVLLLPGLFALIVELYFVAPLHTYFGKGIADQHTIYFIQDWTLGVLWVKVIGRLILWNEHSRPATALRNVVQRGWTDPDVRLATRGFIFPAFLLMSTLMLAPLGLGWLVNTLLVEGDNELRSAVYRYSYPGILALGIGAVALYYAAMAFKGWKRRIRDEVYLIGERLHNFGERRTANAVGGTRVVM
ncbi:MAG: hypothetical protein Q9170_005042 [Blastenia crenularia]